MTQRNEAPLRRQRDSICIIFESEIRRVDLRSATPTRRRGRRAVQLIDLWVASLLPWDVLDLSFEIVGTGPTREAFHSAPIDGQLLARALVTVSTRELLWAPPDEVTPPGVRIESLVARLEWAPTSSKNRSSAPTESGTALSDLSRVLPHAAARYPVVEWREAENASQNLPSPRSRSAAQGGVARP